MLVDAAMRGQHEFVQRQRRLFGCAGRARRRKRRQWPQGIRQFLARAADARSSGSSGSCPACPFASAGCHRHSASGSVAGRARESDDFTLKRNRAERVQIVNGVRRLGRLQVRARRPAGRLAQRLRVARHVFEIDAGERDAEFVLGAGHGRKHDLVQKIGTGMRLVVVLDRSGGAQNIVGGDAPAVAGEFVAAARAANAFQDSAAHQRLQHGFKMPRRQAMARGESLCGDRLSMRLHRHVDDCGDGKNSFAGKQRHEGEKRRVRGIGSTSAVIYYNTCAVQLNFVLVALVDNIRRHSRRAKAARFALCRV